MEHKNLKASKKHPKSKCKDCAKKSEDCSASWKNLINDIYKSKKEDPIPFYVKTCVEYLPK